MTTIPVMDKNLLKLLERYATIQKKIDYLSMETDSICRTSPMGQAPPVFHRKVDQMLTLKEKKQGPIWDLLRCRIIPNSRFKTFWQEIAWSVNTLPPDYYEIEFAYKKYNSEKDVSLQCISSELNNKKVTT